MGLSAPDYSKMSRAGSVERDQNFSTRSCKRSRMRPADSQQLGVLLERALGELDPALVPDGWV